MAPRLTARAMMPAPRYRKYGRTMRVGLLEELKSRGIRVTPQRAIILTAIEQLSGHLTAECVFAAVQEVNRYINLATVYRTLDLLKELDLVTESNMGTGVTQYALRTHGPHHHAICRTCGRSFEFPHQYLSPLIEQLDSQISFVADAHHVVIFGWCATCLQQPDSNHSA
jgi:Fur family ferric uptake transcriptional regulator